MSGTRLLQNSYHHSGVSRVDLSSYAELAVRLVNTASLGHEGGDLLTSMDGLRSLVADREHLNHGITRADLDALRMLRDEFRGFFVACSQGNGADAAARLNELLIQYPVHPQLSGHDGQPWHVHYTESGSMSDKYAAGAAMGLAVRLDRARHRPVRRVPGGALLRACSSTPRSAAPGGTARTGAPAGPTSSPTGPASAARNPAAERARRGANPEWRPRSRRARCTRESVHKRLPFLICPQSVRHKPSET